MTTPPKSPRTSAQLKMIKEFQCPGCVCGGPDPEDCPKLDIGVTQWGVTSATETFSCKNHVPGTSRFGVRSDLFYLGLPKGFDRVGPRYIRHADAVGELEGHHRIRLWLAESHPDWDQMNVPVWAMVHEGALFVRTWSPRINYTYVDVIAGGSLALIPPEFKVIDVATFYNEID